MTRPKTTGALPPARAGESVGARQTFPPAGPDAHPTDDHVAAVGAALPIIRWASLLLTLLCVALTLVTLRANGLLVLASLFLAVHLWAAGAFTRRFWS